MKIYRVIFEQKIKVSNEELQSCTYDQVLDSVNHQIDPCKARFVEMGEEVLEDVLREGKDED